MAADSVEDGMDETETGKLLGESRLEEAEARHPYSSADSGGFEIFGTVVSRWTIWWLSGSLQRV